MKSRQKLRRFSLLFTASFMLMIMLSSVGIQAVVSAAPTPEKTTSFVDTKKIAEAKDFLKATWLVKCFYGNDLAEISESEVDSWDFFSNLDVVKPAIVGNTYGANEDGTWTCENQDNIRVAFGVLGITDARTAYCGLPGATYDGKENNADCIAGVGGHKWDNKYHFGDPQIGNWVIGKAGGILTIDDAAQYLIYYLSFINQCGISITDTTYNTGDADRDDRYMVPIVNPDTPVTMMLGAGISSSGSQVAISGDGGTEYKKGDKASGFATGWRDIWPTGNVISCDAAINKARDYAPKYLAYLNANKDTIKDTGEASVGTNAAEDNTCENNNGVLGWLGCGILTVMDGIVSFLDGQIKSLLLVNTAELSSAGLKDSWAVMRNIAYIILIPMMLVMVIGTALGFGPFDAYTVKKALPRMVLAVIFISLSFYICKFLIDTSNIVGLGIKNLVGLAAPGGEVNSLSDVLGGGEGSLFTGLAAGGLVVGAAIGAVTWGILGSFALVTIVALLIGYVILVLRQVLIVMLVVLAPLAILVWIFPGNDKLWKIWRTTLVAMLMMFPLIMLLIASGRFFAGTADQMYDGATGTFIKLIAYIAPYFFIPATFKFGLGVFGNLAGAVNDRSRGLFDRQKKFRQGTRAQGYQDFKSGSGRGRFKQLGAVRGAGRRVTGGIRGNVGPGAKAYRDARWTGVGANAADEFMKSAEFQAQQDNDPVLQAAASGKNRQEAIANMQRIFGYSEAEAGRHVRNAEATIGLGRKQQIASAKQLVNTGTGYKDVEQMTKTLAVAADGDIGTGSSLAGFANAATKRTGRWELAPSFGTLDGLVQRQMAGGADAPNQGDFDKATMQAVRSATDARTLAATSKPKVYENIAAVAARAQDTVSLLPEDQRQAFINDITATAIEARSNMSSMSSDNVTHTQALINNFDGEMQLNARSMVDDGTARVYRQTDPVTGQEIRYGSDSTRPGGPQDRPPEGPGGPGPGPQ